MGIDEFRRSIDAIDDLLVRLLVERMRVARLIGEEKQIAGLPALDMAREQHVLDKVSRMGAALGFPLNDMETIFVQIVGACRATEHTKAAIEGESGASAE